MLIVFRSDFEWNPWARTSAEINKTYDQFVESWSLIFFHLNTLMILDQNFIQNKVIYI